MINGYFEHELCLEGGPLLFLVVLTPLLLLQLLDQLQPTLYFITQVSEHAALNEELEPILEVAEPGVDLPPFRSPVLCSLDHGFGNGLPGLLLLFPIGRE